ncbi:hypothetical protein J6590_011985 [Homalodisca vitripennis]|nr:hypothetical protein J6590_011985 [Homalodisca vitripennis]
MFPAPTSDHVDSVSQCSEAKSTFRCVPAAISVSLPEVEFATAALHLWGYRGEFEVMLAVNCGIPAWSLVVSQPVQSAYCNIYSCRPQPEVESATAAQHLWGYRGEFEVMLALNCGIPAWSLVVSQPVQSAYCNIYSCRPQPEVESATAALHLWGYRGEFEVMLALNCGIPAWSLVVSQPVQSAYCNIYSCRPQPEVESATAALHLWGYRGKFEVMLALNCGIPARTWVVSQPVQSAYCNIYSCRPQPEVESATAALHLLGYRGEFEVMLALNCGIPAWSLVVSQPVQSAYCNIYSCRPQPEVESATAALHLWGYRGEVEVMLALNCGIPARTWVVSQPVQSAYCNIYSCRPQPEVESATAAQHLLGYRGEFEVMLALNCGIPARTWVVSQPVQSAYCNIYSCRPQPEVESATAALHLLGYRGEFEPVQSAYCNIYSCRPQPEVESATAALHLLGYRGEFEVMLALNCGIPAWSWVVSQPVQSAYCNIYSCRPQPEVEFASAALHLWGYRGEFEVMLALNCGIPAWSLVASQPVQSAYCNIYSCRPQPEVESATAALHLWGYRGEFEVMLALNKLRHSSMLFGCLTASTIGLLNIYSCRPQPEVESATAALHLWGYKGEFEVMLAQINCAFQLGLWLSHSQYNRLTVNILL